MLVLKGKFPQMVINVNVDYQKAGEYLNEDKVRSLFYLSRCILHQQCKSSA